MTGKTESLFFRLPLELRRHIYAMIFGPQRLVDLRHVQCELDPLTRSMIYRPKSEKLHKTYILGNDEDFDGGDEDFDNGDEEKLSESDIEDAHRFSTDFMFEWRTGILEVSRTISNEALDILYGQNTFIVDIHGMSYRKFRNFNAANLRRVHYLRVVAQPAGISHGTALVFDPQIWLPMLEGLLQFCIVAQQPLAAGGYYNAPTLAEDLCNWTSQLNPILNYFSANVPKTAAVSLDGNDCAETTAIMDKYFGLRYKKVRTITGDFYFKRGKYSMESGYWDDDGRDGCNFADGGMGEDWSD